jgi:Domain of unknown function (DUF5666)
VFKLKQILLAAVITAVAVACGSSGSSMSQSSGNTPLMATGVITGFGSIYLNGKHFQTTHAAIRKNRKAVDQSQLAVGEVARIKASMNQTDGTEDADQVDVEEVVVGPISAIDTTAGMGMATITVLGQTVKVNAGTSLSKSIPDIGSLKAGDVIAVDGLVDSNGDIAATRIDKDNGNSPYQVVGTVSNLDTMHSKFKINNLTVDYTGATLTGFTGGAPSNGDVVEVQGTMLDSTTSSTPTLTASVVDRQMTDQEEAGDNGNIELEGLITTFTSATDFVVGEQKVTTTSSTEYRNGTAADLAKDVKVEVEGTISSGVLTATVVTFEHNGGIELQAQADNVMSGSFTLLNVEVTVTPSTRFEDHASGMAMFNLSNVMKGDLIRVHGYESPAGSGKVVATRLEREVPGMTAVVPVIVKGPFTADTSSTFKVLGITINAASASISDGHGGTLPLATFLSQAAGHGVEVQGTWSGTAVMATEIAIDDHNGDEN